jgi:hypothetical protein
VRVGALLAAVAAAMLIAAPAASAAPAWVTLATGTTAFRGPLL